MEDTLASLQRYGELIVFGVVFLEQIGAPIPATPFLLLAGALAGSGRINLLLALALAAAGSILADLLWYGLGRSRGARVLGLLCRVALEPDACVRRTENLFHRHGMRALLFAKFFPGLSTAAPPLAGAFRASVAQFLLYSAAGALLWAGSYALVGYLASDLVEDIARHLAHFGAALVAGALAAFVLYLVWKYWRRRRMLRHLRTRRIAPEDLRAMLARGEPVTVVDLRNALEVQLTPYTIPGAIVIPAEELEARHEEIPRDREVVLYCT